MLPDKLPVEYEIINMSGWQRVKAMAGDGTVYIVEGSELYKSSDYGESLTFMEDLGAEIEHIGLPSDGSIVAITTDYKVWRAEDDESSFTEVFEGTGRPASGMGFDYYDKLVMYAEYSGTGRKLYLSNDFGKSGSWETLLEVADENVNHCHDIRFDPYEGLIWSVWGDNRPYDTILVTDDFGGTWETLVKDHYIRATNIMPLPGCVLFGSDEYYVAGTYKHERPKEGSFQSPIKPYQNWAARKNTFENLPRTWATRPAIKYGKKGIAYWGYRQSDTQGVLPANIYVTDGYKVYCLWTQNKVSDGSSRNGIDGVYGPDDSNVLVACLNSEYNGENWHVVKIQL